MAKETLTVPDIGGAEDAEVIEVSVAVGDTIELEQSLIVLESDKASMEIPAEAAGTVVEVLAKEGDNLKEGDPIVVVDTAGDSSAEAPA
ncbi:MAG: biotin/lipoyl-containing protein, partial [Halieaceae bacterium]|nr:biotin/lipoyl-containing protein [Halieaceae bacterium]